MDYLSIYMFSVWAVGFVILNCWIVYVVSDHFVPKQYDDRSANIFFGIMAWMVLPMFGPPVLVIYLYSKLVKLLAKQLNCVNIGIKKK